MRAIVHERMLQRGFVLLALCCAVVSSSPAVESAAGVIGEMRTHLRATRYVEAEESARAALLLEPEAGDVWHLLGDALQARGRQTLALDAYSQALRYLSSRPLTAQMSMAKIHRHAGRDDDANTLWQAVMRAWRAGDVDGAHELVAVAEAALALGQGDPSRKRTALRLYEEALDRAPDDPAPYIALGELLLSSYNNAEALPLFDKALRIAPQDPRALLAMARSQHFDHEPAALQTARAAVMRAPAWVTARVFLARLLVEQDDPQGAKVELEAALAVNPRSVEALSLLAALHDRDGEGAVVEQVMKLVLIIAPRYGEGYVTLAQMAADRRRYRDAVRYATRALTLDARNWRAHVLVGINQLRLGHNAAARESLEVAFRGDPFNVWTKNTLDLLDAMDGYAVLERGRFVLTGRGDQIKVLAPYLFELAEQAYDVHSARYAVQLSPPIRIEVHPQHDDMSVRTLGIVGADLLGVSFGPTIVIEGPMVNPGGPFNWASVLWHELAHSFQLKLTDGRAPRWLAEGMAVHDEHSAGREGWGQDVGPGFLQAYLQGRLAKASGLNDRFLNPGSADDVGNAYLQAGLLVAMIDLNHGSDSLTALLLGYRDGNTTEQLLGEVLGVSPDEFDTAFDDYLQQRFGAALSALQAPQSARRDSSRNAEPNSGQGNDQNTGPSTTSAASSADTSTYAQLLRTAVAALDSGDLRSAEAALLQARALLPGHTDEHGPHRLLIDLYRRRDDLAAIIDSTRALLRVDADVLAPLLSLASDLQTAGDARGAIDALQRALLIQPFDVSLHERLAVQLESIDEWGAARVERAAVVALGTSDPVGAQYRLALAASRSGDPQGARLALLAALENAPLFEDGLILLLTVREQLALSSTPIGRTRGGAVEERQQ